MELKLYNTLTRKKEAFRPLDPSNVRMYVCGPTVYDYAHIGNARPVIVFDVLFRLLRHIYGPEHVTYVRNITDVDDKIIHAAKEEGVPIDEITARTTKAFHEDVAALGCLPPTFEPRATEHIPQMIAMIEKLVAGGNAYAAQGHVLYDVTKKPDYGKLAHRSTDEMIAGARVEVAPYKKHPMDFVLWKPSAEGQPGWPSPWGRGRPGWHIECSAMGEALLGETFDIHGGGIDLVFPHHENEIAQSESAHHGAPLASFWMHNGFLEVEGAKMSKSLGNFVTIHELLDEFPAGAIRLAMLETHYTQPINWTRDKVRAARDELSEWAARFSGSQAEIGLNYHSSVAHVAQSWRPHQAVIEALGDDLNTPGVITALRALYRKNDDASYLSLIASCAFLGLFEKRSILAYHPHLTATATEVGPQVASEIWPQADALKVAWINKRLDVVEQIKRELASKGLDAILDTMGGLSLRFASRVTYARPSKDPIEVLVAEREAARKAKKFAEADRIRQELEQMGVILKDTPEGTKWELKR
jgi:cysteinyl-tRNA synthetase